MILKKIDKSGVASIPLVMGLLILIISVGVFISSISLSDSLSSSNQQKSSLALEYAETGAQDALMRISRMPCNSCLGNFQLEMVSGGCTGSIMGCAIATYTPATLPTSSEIIVTSEGRINDISRKVQVNVILSSEGKLATSTWK